jgi:predicted phosphoribosyltransferase
VLLRDRSDAGLKLADRLQSAANRARGIVIALPRGGVPVGFEIAQRLGAPLDIRVIRKIGAPQQPEFAVGAIASGGIEFVNSESIRALRLSHDQVNELVEQTRKELSRIESVLRGDHPMIEVSGAPVILVDDGLATGATMRVAITVLRTQMARCITIAVPVGAHSVIQTLAREVDELVCLHTPDDFEAVSKWYEDFRQVSDEEVRDLLAVSRGRLLA